MGTILQSGLIALLLAAAGPAETPRSVASTSVGPDRCLIHGTAVDANTVPLHDMPVRLRNLQTKTVEQLARTNAAGEYSFVALPDTPYVVELVNYPGRVLAVGEVMTVQGGAAAGGMIVVPAPLSALAIGAGSGSGGLFNQSTGAIVSAITGAGMTVLSAAPPLSPEK